MNESNKKIEQLSSYAAVAFTSPLFLLLFLFNLPIPMHNTSSDTGFSFDLKPTLCDYSITNAS